MISASFDAWPRPSRSSQPKTRMTVRYRSRIGTDRELASSRSAGQTAGHRHRSEFWSSTGVCGLRAQIAELADAIKARTVTLVDVGGDIIARGDEPELLSPLADSMT